MPVGFRFSTTNNTEILRFLQEIERFGGEDLRRDGDRVARHDVGDRGFQLAGAQLRSQIGVHEAPQIAVGDDADQLTGIVDDADHAETARADRQDGLRHPAAGIDQRKPFGVHDLGHAPELRAEFAAGVDDVEVAFPRNPFAP